jgi:hypothetical protein
MIDSRGFSLLRFDKSVDPSALLSAAAERGVPIMLVDIVPIVPTDTASSGYTRAATLYEKKLVLVRPDIIVAWRGDEVPSTIDGCLGVIDTIRGAGSSSLAAVGEYRNMRRRQEEAGGDGGDAARDDFAKKAIAKTQAGKETTGFDNKNRDQPKPRL